ncbi:GntR family transcriptional regulator [Microbacterium sp. 179-I 3D3 NHS]|uniref:GntR family transcriptional regulator n=1 Tax=Microbacterium sp. 179-I 3D3 NHS TaxID=3142382 RepID=UPI00399F313E
MLAIRAPATIAYCQQYSIAGSDLSEKAGLVAIDATGFDPAVRRVLSDEVTDQLRDAIVVGKLRPGARLREDELAAQMQVSRGPVRQALVTLEREGLVIIERYKGARVAELYRSDIDQVFSLRRALETLAVEWACDHATKEELDRLDTVLDRYVNATSEGRTPQLISEVDLAFHDGLIAAAHHDRLANAWEALRSQILSFLMTRMALRKDYDAEWEPDHRRILDLIRAGDKESAVERIRHHVNASYSRVVDAMEKRE